MNPETVVFDRYQLHERIGAGGMGVVWKATDRLLRQIVALKHVFFATQDSEQAQLTRDRALREARLAAQLRGHPHVVSIYDVLVDDGGIWLVMEYLPAHSLSELLRAHGRLDAVQVARIGVQVADALAAGHALGIEHRDVKPGNVLITAEGTVKITDYGISHLAGDTRLTHTGISGTPAYLAPEVATNGESSPASDVFSLGSTLYDAVEGQPPFGTDDNTLRLLRTVRSGIIRPPHHAGPLEPFLLRLLHRDPVVRPDAATAGDLLTRLIASLTSPTGQLPPRPGPPSRPLAPPPLPPQPLAPPSPAPPPPAPPPWWRHRRTAVAAAALTALVTAGVIGVNTLGANSGEAQPPPAAGPPAPATAPPCTVLPTREPVAAVPVANESPAPDPVKRNVTRTDPCPLIDIAALTPFNQAPIATPPLRCPSAP
ncbi:MAG: serine/threonine-protein kinase [Pseudonocardiaceae bacterium]